ncbi:MAG: hypothetical protein HQL54_13170 [Magnetococcales bacterium]|nr:hypothetical protein [Magnetococcales bacterium]
MQGAPAYETLTDDQLAQRILKLLHSGDEKKATRVMAFSLLYRKIYGRKLDKVAEKRLLMVLDKLMQEKLVGRYPDIGVAEPPYFAIIPDSE